MSGFEIVGVILGSLPIVVKTAENYSKIADSLVKWKRYRFELRKLVNDVDIERLNFESLCKQLLKCTDLPFERQNEVLEGNDAHAWGAADVGRALRKKLGQTHGASVFLLDSMSEDLMKLQEMLSSKDGSTKWMDPNENDLEYQLKRLSYSFGSAGSRILESLSTSRRKLKGLLNTLDDSDTQVERRGRAKLTSNHTNWVRALKCVRQSAGNLHNAVQRGWNHTCSNPHPTSLQLRRRNVQEPQRSFVLSLGSHQQHLTSAEFACTFLLARSFNESLVLVDDNINQSSHSKSVYLSDLKAKMDIRAPLDKKGIEIYHEVKVQQKLSKNHSTTSSPLKSAMKRRLQGRDLNQNISIKMTIPDGVNRKQVRMERPPSEHTCIESGITSQPTKPNHIPQPDFQISDLCRLLQLWKLDRDRMGYLLGPENSRHDLQLMRSCDTLKWITLDDLLQSRSYRLDRCQRYKAALVLASSVLELQTTPWMPRNLSKKHLYFEILPDNELSHRPLIYVPTEDSLLLPDQCELTAKEVRNLTCASLTSLGILLLELIFNCAIESKDELRSDHLHNGQPHRDTNYLVAREWADEVEKEAGWGFMHAIKSCFDFEEKPDWNNPKFIISIHERVVKTLENELNTLGWGSEDCD